MKFYNIFVHMFFFFFLVTLLQGNWNVTLTTHNNLKKFDDIFVLFLSYSSPRTLNLLFFQLSWGKAHFLLKVANIQPRIANALLLSEMTSMPLWISQHGPGPIFCLFNTYNTWVMDSWLWLWGLEKMYIGICPCTS